MGVGVLDAVARGDRKALVTLVQAAAAMHDEKAALVAQLARLWLDWLEGKPSFDSARHLEPLALAQSEPQWVIELAALSALFALEAEDLEEALKLARRASRMARTEEMPQHEYLAHLVLARVRRVTGQPWLATRILSGLHNVASDVWSGWIAWETLFSSGRAITHSKLGEFATATSALVDAVQRAVDGATQALDTVACDLVPVNHDIISARAVLQLSHDPPVLHDWIHGVGIGIPSVVHGMFVDEQSRDAPVWIHVGRGRRISRKVARTSGIRLLEPSSREGSREEHVIAVLADGRAWAPDALFREVYGFGYRPDLHENTFRVLLHRCKHRLPEDATFVTGESIQLRVDIPFLVADPRCTLETDAFVFGALARLRSAGAKELAEDLGLSVRAVQKALRRLKEEGACSVDRDGRSIKYTVEDTTFEEPSRHHRGVRSFDV